MDETLNRIRNFKNVALHAKGTKVRFTPREIKKDGELAATAIKRIKIGEGIQTSISLTET